MGNATKSSLQLNILYGEGSPEVLASNAPYIQKAGHKVETAQGRKGVADALKSGNFDLVILGSSLTRDDRHHLPYIIKKAKGSTRVLVMHADGGRHPQVDGNIDTGHSMDELLAKVTTLLSDQLTTA